jgi:cytochrome c2
MQIQMQTNIVNNNARADADAKLTRRQSKKLALLARIAKHGKRCSSCHGIKPADNFYANAAHGDGLQSTCKLCHTTHEVLMKQGTSVAVWRTIRDAMRAQNAKVAAAAAQAPDTK